MAFVVITEMHLPTIPHKQEKNMRLFLRTFGILMVTLLAMEAYSQSHHSNWVHRNAIDTTVVPCWNDTLGHVSFPPNSMGMMFPDSMYCRLETMCLDSIPHPHDSTFMGWCRIQIGRDSMHFDMMDCDSSQGGHHQLTFMRDVQCRLHWDSLMCDSSRRHWRPTGIRGWNGTGWTLIPGVTFDGNTAVFTTSELYGAFAFVGEPSSPAAVTNEHNQITGFRLEQNYPNPFNPSTTFAFSLPTHSSVTLTVYNLLGENVATLFSGELDEGTHKLEWQPNDLASGLYLYRLRAGNQASMGKLILLK